MIRKATNYVPFDDDPTLLDDCGVARPAVGLGDHERWYDPATEQFFTTDPVGYGYADGANFFAFCANDPCSAVDPTGLDVDEILAGIGITPAELEELKRPYQGRGLDPALFQHHGRARWFNPEVGEFLHDE